MGHHKGAKQCKVLQFLSGHLKRLADFSSIQREAHAEHTNTKVPLNFTTWLTCADGLDCVILSHIHTCSIFSWKANMNLTLDCSVSYGLTPHNGWVCSLWHEQRSHKEQQGRLWWMTTPSFSNIIGWFSGNWSSSVHKHSDQTVKWKSNFMSTSAMYVQSFYNRRKWDAMSQALASDNTPSLI